MSNQAGDPVLRASGITKRYPGVVALDDVDLEVRRGEVHVLFGENGAGKSTLISVLSGAQQPDAGTLELEGHPAQLNDVAAARARGISAVFQEFSLAPSLTVAENLVLGSEPGRLGFVDRREVRRIARERLAQFGFSLDPDAVVETLSRAEQQMVEIAKAFRPELSVLILDEPTASLTDQEAERLFELVNEARRRGVGIVYVTHRMGEIRRLADRITVLRDGRLVATVPGQTPEDELINLMTGRVVETLYPELPEPGTTALVTVEGLTTHDGRIQDVSFHVNAGEIVGLAGLVGSGKSEAARACFGLERVASGRVTVSGHERTGASPRQMLKAGVVYLPSDRKKEGLFLQRPLRESVTLPWLAGKGLAWGSALRRRAERVQARAMTERMELSPADPERPAASYSGGNQQKGLLGRALLGDCSVYLLDEPTVGVDVGARVTIYRQLVELAGRGHAVVVISSELPEILHLCHRAYVFSNGRVAAELAGEQITEAAVLRHMMHWDDASGSDAA
jgi:ribose transport system ATP-binding protein